LLTGCDAGFLNGIKIKGAHTAIKTGMLAGESVYAALAAGDSGYSDLASYEKSVRESWVYDELYRARNFGPALHKLGTFLGATFTYLDQNLFRGRLPFTLRNREADHETLMPAAKAPLISYAKPDGVISFDRLSSVFLSGTNHEEDQPSHLTLKDASLPISYNLPEFDEPAQRYCPAGVYEIVTDDGEPRLQINAQNCVHCKTCDIKDPKQNIVWLVPEGGGGPNYTGM
jgi:electron-transferring-flavoprotein dehydrogenase